MVITLYSTQGCHLCEQAYQLLVQAGVQDRVQTIDTALDDTLFSRYGVTIPVLSLSHIPSVELNWPFDITQLRDWLSHNNLVTQDGIN
ncbi:glutaredoxin family protein [Photobacterium damselae]|uniref:glutaredoxin family protein n=1 Tax=Photobacterium damselae TaxID=38293 RepID=UPI000D662076|nr:glutaredoxin family protein [Photobacterium damselae]AWK81882.1 NrdH-redoxin [Photobacterium damselae]